MDATPPSGLGGSDNSYFPGSKARKRTTTTTKGGESSRNTPSNPQNPTVSTISEARHRAGEQEDASEKHKKKHRRNKRRRHRRPSFAGPTDSPNPEPTLDTTMQGQVIEEEPQDKGSVPNTGHPLHRLCQSGTNLSDSSLDSEALLDHR